MSEEGKDNKIRTNFLNVLNILSKKPAYTIFLACANSGLSAESDTSKKLNLTRKQYYTRLRQLDDDLGLIKKVGGVYKHTKVGAEIYELVENGFEIYAVLFGPLGRLPKEEFDKRAGNNDQIQKYLKLKTAKSDKGTTSV